MGGGGRGAACGRPRRGRRRRRRRRRGGVESRGGAPCDRRGERRRARAARRGRPRRARDGGRRHHSRRRRRGGGRERERDDAGRQLLLRIHELSHALTDRELLCPAAAAPSPRTLRRQARGRPLPRAPDASAEAALRGALGKLARVAAAPGDAAASAAAAAAAFALRALVPCLAELRRRVGAANAALARLHRSLPPPPANAAPLSAIAVGRMLLSMAGEASDHPGAEAAKAAAPEVADAIGAWQRAGIADALGTIASDLALHAHTLARHLRRALPPAHGATCCKESIDGAAGGGPRPRVGAAPRALPPPRGRRRRRSRAVASASARCLVQPPARTPPPHRTRRCHPSGRSCSRSSCRCSGAPPLRGDPAPTPCRSQAAAQARQHAERSAAGGVPPPLPLGSRTDERRRPAAALRRRRRDA